MVLCDRASALHRSRERDQRLATVVRDSTTRRATAGCAATITTGWSTCFHPFVGWNPIRAGCHSFCVENHSRANDLQEGDSLPFDELGPFDGGSRRTQRNQPGPLWNFGSLWLESRGNLPTPDGKIAEAIRKHTRHRMGVGQRQRGGRQLTLAHRLCIHIVW